MQITLQHRGKTLRCDLSRPIDLSLPLGQVRCFYAPPLVTKPYESEGFVGAVSAGAAVNFYDVQLNPHGNGTHTECLGHITEAHESLNQQLKRFHFIAQLVTVPLQTVDNGDQLISVADLSAACPEQLPSALIIRTTNPDIDKTHRDYSGTNPPYLSVDAARWLVEKNVEHLLLDLPSVDREQDEGVLAAHHVFWGVDDQAASDESRKNATITELIFVANEVADGLYLLNIQFPPLELDAVSSRVVIFALAE